MTSPSLARSLPRVPAYAILAAGGLCALWIMLGTIIAPAARRHDFLNLYTGASLAREGNFARMHLPQTQLERERRFVPETPELVPFVRLPFYAALLAPLAGAPFQAAFWIWIAVQAMLLLAVWAWVLARWGGDALILAALFLPAALGIAHGQDCVVMLAIVTGGYVLARRGSDFAAGSILGLGLIKFHLFLMWPLALVIQKRWRLAAGACAAVGTELAVSLALAGPSGLRAYFDLLRRKDLNRLSPSPELMINLHSAAINLGLDALAVKAILIAAAVGLAAVACYRAPLWRWVAAAAAGSLLVPPHVYGYDAALLLVPLLLAVFESGSKPVATAATVLPTPLPFLAALAGSPWAAAAPVALMAFLATLAAETRRAR